MPAQKTLPHKQLRTVVTDRLRSAIQTGIYVPGAWLRQQQIAESLGVSQMPVREALKTLAAEGLVEHLPYRGARVIALSAVDIQDLYAQRGLLEGRACRAAVAHLSRADLDGLQDIVAAMAGNLDYADLDTYRRLNRQFHQAIYRASRRPYLIRTLDQLWSTAPTMLWGHYRLTRHATLPERDAADLNEHRAILSALAAEEDAAAGRLMEDHILAAGRHLASAAGQTNSA